MKRFTPLFVLTLPLCISFTALAQPTINGTTISLPNDGWYQVQSADTYSTVCEGLRSCQVEPGSYHVINHTTQQRFENILVTDTTSATADVLVSGTTISWPDDGWYQVQSADNFLSVCEGGRSCEVSAGNYIVINHSTGKRHTDIRVEGEISTGPNTGQPPGSSEGYTLNGNTISWPADGWYQVQSATDYRTLCEGGSSCVVPNGTYNVINLSNGRRIENVAVAVAAPQPDIPPVEPDPDPSEGIPFDWDITVPGYVSNALQLRVFWGDQEMATRYVRGQHWAASGVITSHVRQPLIVTFYDRNGEIILGRYEGTIFYPTHTEDKLIGAFQFDTDRWDDDNDGISNIDELRAGTDPLVHYLTEQPAINLAEAPEELIHTLAGYQLDNLSVIVEDLMHVITQTQTIVWPNSDWYQVQHRESYESICEGGSECALLPGLYTLTNHTTGTREILDVPELSVAEQANASPLPNQSFTVEDPRWVTETATMERMSYACENGGSLISERVDVNPLLTEYLYIETDYPIKGTFKRRGYLFNQCSVTLRDGPLPDGTYLLQGSLYTEFRDYLGWRDYLNRFSYEGFSIVGDNGVEYRAQGKTQYLEDNYNRIKRDATISEYFRKLPGAEAGDMLADVRYQSDHQLNSPGSTNYRRYSLSANGTVQNGKTSGQRVTLTTESPLTADLREDGARIPFNGSIAMNSEDGGLLHLRANPTWDPQQDRQMFVDIDYTPADGNNPSSSQMTPYSPTRYPPRCGIERNEGGRELVCIPPW